MFAAGVVMVIVGPDWSMRIGPKLVEADRPSSTAVPVTDVVVPGVVTGCGGVQLLMVVSGDAVQVNVTVTFELVQAPAVYGCPPVTVAAAVMTGGDWFCRVSVEVPWWTTRSWHRTPTR